MYSNRRIFNKKLVSAKRYPSAPENRFRLDRARHPRRLGALEYNDAVITQGYYPRNCDSHSRVGYTDSRVQCNIYLG
jgi:hypothetical protein